MSRPRAHLSPINVFFSPAMFFIVWWVMIAPYTLLVVHRIFKSAKAILFPHSFFLSLFLRQDLQRWKWYLVFDAFANLNGIFEPTKKNLSSNTKKESRLRKGYDLCNDCKSKLGQNATPFQMYLSPSSSLLDPAKASKDDKNENRFGNSKRRCDNAHARTG